MEIFSNINFNLLPVKLHYFLYYGGEAGVLPFIPVIAGQIGISAIALGIVFTVLPFVSLASKPFFGGIVDHLQKLKLFLLIFVVLACVSYLAISFIPRIHSPTKESETEITISCNSNGSYFHIAEKAKHFFDKRESNRTSCIVKCNSYFCLSQNVSINWTEMVNNTILQIPSIDMFICNYKYLKYSIEFMKSKNTLDNRTEITNAAGDGLTIQPLCLAPLVFNCNMSCNDKNETHWSTDHLSTFNVYETMQFWLFFLFTMVAWVSSSVVTSLSDAACYEVLQGKDELYGKQRMWGTIGWGSFSLFTGYLNELVTAKSSIKNYTPSFYMLAALMVCDLFTVAKSDIKNAKIKREPTKNVCALLAQIHILLFVLVVFIVGALTGLHWSYFFWYMNELKADQLMMGLAVGIQSFLGELPFFFFAGKVIGKVGHVNTANLALIFYFLRYMIYSFVYNPWLVLPVELLQGPTFALFYAAMTSYAKFIAPTGSEATMQGILGGVFEGLGIAVGSFLGGIGIDYHGTHETFRIAGIVAIVCLVLHIIFDLTLSRRKRMLKKEHPENEVEESELSPCVS